MEGLNVAGEIKLNEECNVISYEKILSNINYIPKKSIIERLKNNMFLSNIKLDKEVIMHAN